MKKIVCLLFLLLSYSFAQSPSRFIWGKVVDYDQGEKPMLVIIHNSQGSFEVGHGAMSQEGIFWLILDKDLPEEALEPLFTEVRCTSQDLKDIALSSLSLEFADGSGYIQQASSIEVLEQGIFPDAQAGAVLYTQNSAVIASDCEASEAEDIYQIHLDFTLEPGWNKIVAMADADASGFQMVNMTEELPWFVYIYY